MSTKGFSHDDEYLVLTKEGIQTIGVFGKVLLPGGYIWSARFHCLLFKVFVVR